jgi:hypothetical protein
MTVAKPYDVVRSTADVQDLHEDRTIPAGSEGTVVEAKDDGTVLVDFELEPPTEDGDYVFQAVLSQGQYEVVPQQ